MVVRFYEWDPRGTALGHASLTLRNGTHISWWPGEEDVSALSAWLSLNGVKGIAKTIGFSPAKMVTLLSSVPISMTYPLKPQCMMSYQDDVMLEGREADRKVKLRDCLLDQNKILAWWEEAKNKESYILKSNNCATMVIKALHAGESTYFAEIPSDYFMWTPYRVYEYCEKLSNLKLLIR